MSSSYDTGLLRIVDANLDRAAEGLRVAEDLLRFLVDDREGREALRSLRGRVWGLVEEVLPGRLLAARESVEDVGRGTPSRPGRLGYAALFRTNLHRVQEALRVLEEVFAGAFPEQAQKAAALRFDSYSIEKNGYPLLARMDNRGKMDFDLYVVTGAEQSRGRTFEEVVEAALRGGAGAIQLRAKELEKREVLKVAREIGPRVRETGALFIVNDHLDVALACGADGVHLGQNDLPLSEARKIAGPDVILGASSHSLEEALEAEAEGADYINVGPVFPTRTKEHATGPVGVDLIRQLAERLIVPQTCMGGIGPHNVAEAIRAGAERVAVVSAVVGAEDIEAATRDLVERIREAKGERLP